MADDTHNTPETFDPVGAESPKEDAATKATREELKHTVISDAPADAAASTAMDEDKGDRATPKAGKTPDLKPYDAPDASKEQVSSPKKKRAHDEVDESQEASVSPALSGASSPRDPNGASRGDRSEPEKKRARDEPEGQAKKPADPQSASASDSSKAAADEAQKDVAKTSTSAASMKENQRPTLANEDDKAITAGRGPVPTSSSAFANSGFAKLSGTASPFGALGAGAAKTGGFGGAQSSSPSPFGALAAGSSVLTAAPKLSFGTAATDKPGAASTSSAAASPFAALNGGVSKGFGSAFGSGFGGGIGGPKLTSFAKPGGVLTDTKPARPFGAPESDNENDSGEENDDEPDTGAEEQPESEEKEPEEPKQAGATDDKKKLKLQKVVVDDGEAGETSVFVARAKVYQLDTSANVWKERGAGILKVNVPQATVDFDAHGSVIPGSFDASMLEAEDDGEDVKAGATTASNGSKVVRLIMRQDHTHRVVVNSAVTGATEFLKRETLKAVTFVFTAVEGPEAKLTTLQIKMSPASAESFFKTIELIQNELKSLG